MIKVQILGANCNKCNKLYQLTKQVVKENNIEAEVIKVEDIQEILKHNVMMTPCLVVNGKVKSVGKIPSIDDLKELINQ